MGTSSDALLIAEMHGGRRACFVEWKYRETGGAEDRLDGDSSEMRRRMYAAAYAVSRRSWSCSTGCFDGREGCGGMETGHDGRAGRLEPSEALSVYRRVRYGYMPAGAMVEVSTLCRAARSAEALATVTRMGGDRLRVPFAVGE